MSAAEAQSEPTMEEILASIRKIISEDDVSPVEPVSDSSGEDFGDDVLELSEPVQELAIEPEVVSPDFDFDALDASEAEPAPIEDFASDDEIIVMDREPEPEPYFEEPAPEPVYNEPESIYEPAPVYAAPPPTMDPRPLEASIGLIGAQTAEATAAAFSRMGPALPGHFASGASVEELVSYLLKPMLKEWLDLHLPRIVEERVEAELARIARRGF